MDAGRRRRLVYAAGGLVMISAIVHLYLGVAGLFDPAVVDAGSVVVPGLFMLAGVAALGLVWIHRREALSPRATYAGGTVLMIVFVAMYLDWHVLQLADAHLPLDVVGVSTEQLQAHDHGHAHDHHHADGGGSAAAVLLDHLRSDPLALVAKTSEVLAAVVLTILAVETRS